MRFPRRAASTTVHAKGAWALESLLIGIEEVATSGFDWQEVAFLFAGGLFGLIGGFILGGRNSKLEESRRRTARSEDAARRIVETSEAIWNMHSGLGRDEEPPLEPIRTLLIQMGVDAQLITDIDARTRLLTARKVYNNVGIAVTMVDETSGQITWRVNREVAHVAGAVMRNEKQPPVMKDTDGYSDLIDVKIEAWEESEKAMHKAWREEQERKGDADTGDR